MKHYRPVIYQLLPRVFSNTKTDGLKFGTIHENGCGKLNHINNYVIHQIRKQGFTHIWFTGIIEHATCTDYAKWDIPASNPRVVKGRAGSPYAIRDYYDIDPDLAENVPSRMNEFEQLVQRCHKAHMGLIIDFVPNHVAREYISDATPDGIAALGSADDSTQSFSPGNNFYYLPGQSLKLPDEIKNLPYNQDSDTDNYHESPARATGNDRFTASPEITDWYETIKLNYGVDYLDNHKKHFDPIPDTWHKMLDILLFWAGKKVDGFRCDMAEMVPVEFWNWVIPKVKEKYPDMLFIAEIYNPDAYLNYIEYGKFDCLYDKVGLYDTLKNVMAGHAHARSITNEWQKLDGLDRYMLRFMENHDEQRIASVHFAGNARAGLPAMAISVLMNTGPVMLYSGQESGEPAEGESGFSGDDGRTSIFDYCSMPGHLKWVNNGKYDGGQFTKEQKRIFKFYTRLMNLCHHEVFRLGNFYDLMWCNEDNENFDGKFIYAFVRYYKDKVFLVISNFHKAEKRNIRVRFPADLMEKFNANNLSRVTGKDILEGKVKTLSATEKIQNTGIDLVVEPLSAYVFSLKFESE